MDIDDPRLNDLLRSTFSEMVMVPTGERILNKNWTRRLRLKVFKVQQAALLNGSRISF